MGLSTFIEINNDFTRDIEVDSEAFMAYLIRYLNSGYEVPHNRAITKIITLHRDDKKCQAIQKLLKD